MVYRSLTDGFEDYLATKCNVNNIGWKRTQRYICMSKWQLHFKKGIAYQKKWN